MRLIYTVIALLTIFCLCSAKTIQVPGDYPTIQYAINAAMDGDTILVDPGTYLECINYKKKSLTIKSTAGPHLTTIYGDMSVWAVVTIDAAAFKPAVFEGFTVMNGGNAIASVTEAYVTVTGNIIRDCKAHDWIGIDFTSPSGIVSRNIILNNFGLNTCSAIATHGSGSVIENNIIVANKIYDPGKGVNAGIYVYGNGGDFLIRNNIIYNNWNAIGIYVFLYPQATIENNLIMGNSGGIKCTYKTESYVANNTIVQNVGGSGISADYSDTKIEVVNSIVRDNKPDQIGGNLSALLTITYSNIQGGFIGTGNVDADPLFSEGGKGFRYLGQILAGQPADSPCVDAGAGPSSNFGMDAFWTRTDGVPDSGIVDMGYHFGPFMYPCLQADQYLISESTGGASCLLLDAGTANANRDYLLLGSLTDSFHGTTLPGGMATLPFEIDGFTNWMIGLINTPIFSNFSGTLDANGSAIATFDTLGPFTGGADLHINFAYVLNNPWDFVSSPVVFPITP